MHTIWTSPKFCHVVKTQPLPKQQNLDSSKLREFADYNYEFDDDGGKTSKLIENTVGKGEIACYEQFLFCPQCFQRPGLV